MCCPEQYIRNVLYMTELSGRLAVGSDTATDRIVSLEGQVKSVYTLDTLTFQP